ncbi:HTH domain-containing protein [Microbacterium sp. LWH3-1.2]|uniref:HTH domain-containing protein n=1 Tax=Microbacterium sp. LWH3-1.2 TaxID=3135256 RepID=UPI00341B6012
MTSHGQSVVDELKRLVAEGHISVEALHVITGVPADSVRALLGQAPLVAAGLSPKSAALAANENRRLSILTAQLTDGMQIGDDERLKGIVESLTIECHLTLENIAGLTGLDVHDLELALQAPQALSADKKYALATKSSYLINAINQARG